MAPEPQVGQPTMYERVGGGLVVAALVDAFYEAILADPVLAPRFHGVDMPTLRRHQATLLSQVLGGPRQYAGRQLDEVHAALGVTGEEFTRVRDHLTLTLHAAGAAPDIIGAVEETVESLRPSIVRA